MDTDDLPVSSTDSAEVAQDLVMQKCQRLQDMKSLAQITWDMGLASNLLVCAATRYRGTFPEPVGWVDGTPLYVPDDVRTWWAEYSGEAR